MEAIAILGAEIVAALVTLSVLAAEIALTLVVFAVRLLAWLAARKPPEQRPVWSRRWNEAQRQTVHRIGRITSRVALGLLALSVAALLVINYAMLDETVGWLVRRIEARSDIAVSYETMQGDLLRGSLDFTGVRVTQDSSDTARFDLQVDRASIRFSFWDAVLGRRKLENFDLSGVSGTYARLRTPPSTDGPPAIIAKRDRLMVRLAFSTSPGAFAIKQLTVTNGELLIEDRTQPTPIRYPVVIRSIHAEPLRGSFLWFDLLYRSNLDLTIDGADVSVENHARQGERFTRWSVTDVPAPVLASLAGGPFALFTGGRVDLVAEDTWTLEREAEITMDWHLRLREVVAAVPPGTPPFLEAPTRVFVEHVNARKEPWEFGFTLHLRESQFAGAATLDTREIWAGATEAFFKESLGLDDATITDLKERARSGLAKFEEYIKQRDQRRTKPPAADER